MYVIINNVYGMQIYTHIWYNIFYHILWYIYHTFNYVMYVSHTWFTYITLFYIVYDYIYYVSLVQLLSLIQFIAISWTIACQASLSIINFQSLLNLMSSGLVMPPNHFILWCPLFHLQSFSASGSFPVRPLCIRWPKYWSFSFSISPSNEYTGLISFRID